MSRLVQPELATPRQSQLRQPPPSGFGDSREVRVTSVREVRHDDVDDPDRQNDLEDRVLMSAAVEPIDGTGNNVANPILGSAGTDLLQADEYLARVGVKTMAGPAKE